MDSPSTSLILMSYCGPAYVGVVHFRLYFHGGTPAEHQELYLRRGGGDTLFLWDDSCYQLIVEVICQLEFGEYTEVDYGKNQRPSETISTETASQIQIPFQEVTK